MSAPLPTIQCPTGYSCKPGTDGVYPAACPSEQSCKEDSTFGSTSQIFIIVAIIIIIAAIILGAVLYFDSKYKFIPQYGVSNYF